MSTQERVNILLVDDQPAKLMSYEVILGELGENLIKASSGREALEILLKNEIAVILIDVCMPELDGFQLAAMIRDHPRFQKTAIIFISAIQMEDVDRLRGYQMGAVDYVPVPVIAAVLQAKVRVFAELYRKTRQLEQLNAELERRVAERTAEIQAMMERQHMLAREVDHRAKNALAVVQSVVRLSRASSIGEFVKALEGRIRALSIVHTILSETRWRSADLRVLVE
ncbi:MAG: response regulator, partial [Alphaproteobacteria bacterium]